MINSIYNQLHTAHLSFLHVCQSCRFVLSILQWVLWNVLGQDSLMTNSFYVHCCQTFWSLNPCFKGHFLWICCWSFSQNTGGIIQVPFSFLFTIKRPKYILSTSSLSLVYLFFFAKLKAFPLNWCPTVSYTLCQVFLPTCPGDTYWSAEICGLMSFISSELLAV